MGTGVVVEVAWGVRVASGVLVIVAVLVGSGVHVGGSLMGVAVEVGRIIATGMVGGGKGFIAEVGDW